MLTIDHKYLDLMVSKAIRATQAQRVHLTKVPRSEFFCERHICCPAMGVDGY